MDRFDPTGKVAEKLVHLSEVDHFSRSDRSEILVEWIAPLADGKYCGINENVFFIAEVVVVVIRTFSPQYFLIQLPSANFSSSTRG